jgi:hypothetical protein
MAGANPLTTTNRPDLRTVHVNQALDHAQWCFDKAVANSPPGGGAFKPEGFHLGGYRFDTFLGAVTVAVDSSNTNCIQGTMEQKDSGGSGAVTRDLKSYSFGSVDDGQVVFNAGGSQAPGNIGDSTANLDSNSHNGTVDHTTAPDLVGVGTPDTTNNQLIYSFDQEVHHSGSAWMPQGTGRFLFYDANGDPHWGVPIGADTAGNVLVQFCTSPATPLTIASFCTAISEPPGGSPVSTAKRAVVIRGNSHSTGRPGNGSGSSSSCGFPSTNRCGAVRENAGDNQRNSPTESVAVPGTDGATSRPDLLSAALVPGPSGTNQIDYTFSVPISTGVASDFTAVASNAQETEGEAETVISPNTVRVTFPSTLQNIQEMLVKASAYGPHAVPSDGFDAKGAVQSVNNPKGNSTGGVPVGNNAGAFATGFSNGPDATSVTFDNATGGVVVQMDQRVDPVDVNVSPGHWELLANDGTIIVTAPNSASVNNTGFLATVSLTYNPSDLARATALLIDGPPASCEPWSSVSPPASGGTGSCSTSPAAETFDTTGFDETGTVRQVVSPTASAAAFHDPATGPLKVRWTKASKKQIRRALKRARRHSRHRHRHRR